jgi:hypothetical protein
MISPAAHALHFRFHFPEKASSKMSRETNEDNVVMPLLNSHHE